jgi:hypothetical protein
LADNPNTHRALPTVVDGIQAMHQAFGVIAYVVMTSVRNPSVLCRALGIDVPSLQPCPVPCVGRQDAVVDITAEDDDDDDDDDGMVHTVHDSVDGSSGWTRVSAALAEVWRDTVASHKDEAAAGSSGEALVTSAVRVTLLDLPPSERPYLLALLANFPSPMPLALFAAEQPLLQRAASPSASARDRRAAEPLGLWLVQQCRDLAFEPRMRRAAALLCAPSLALSLVCNLHTSPTVVRTGVEALRVFALGPEVRNLFVQRNASTALAKPNLQGGLALPLFFNRAGLSALTYQTMLQRLHDVWVGDDAILGTTIAAVRTALLRPVESASHQNVRSFMHAVAHDPALLQAALAAGSRVQRDPRGLPSSRGAHAGTHSSHRHARALGQAHADAPMTTSEFVALMAQHEVHLPGFSAEEDEDEDDEDQSILDVHEDENDG